MLAAGVERALQPLKSRTIAVESEVGIGTTAPLSKLDVNGGMAVGSYAGTNAAPANGAIISGNVGIGTTSPATSLHISGAGETLRIDGGATNGPALSVRDNRVGAADGQGWKIGGSFASIGDFYLEEVMAAGGTIPRLMVQTDGTVRLGADASASPALVVSPAGNVGIGTTNMGGATGPVLALANNGATAPSAVAGQGILYVSAGALKYQGPTTLTTVAAADYAEDMPVSGNVEAAEVVSVSADREGLGPDTYNCFKVERAKTAYGTDILGVTSSFQAAGRNPKAQPVALVGRVPVKVTLENGPIRVGDYLTASAARPGRAMKATRTGRVIGIALGEFDGKSGAEGKVLCFVNPHTWVNPADHEKLREQYGRVEDEVESLRRDLADLRRTMGKR